MSGTVGLQKLLAAECRTQAFQAAVVRHEAVDAGKTDILTEAEQARVARLVAPGKQGSLLHSLTAIRQHLSGWLSAPADQLRIAHDEDGAPSLPDYPALSLSISRTPHRTAIALSDTCAVGIDIEQVRPLDWLSMLSMISEHEEADVLRRLAGEGTDLRPFFRAWTVKEAIMKAAGQGFRFGPKRVAVPEELLTGNTTREILESNGRTYSLIVGEQEDHVFAIARCGA